MPRLSYRDTTTDVWVSVATVGRMGPTGPMGSAPPGTFFLKWVGTQAEYDAIVTKNVDTLYVVVADAAREGG